MSNDESQTKYNIIHKKQKIMKIMTDLVKMMLISILTAAMFIGIAL
jgi:hypothetical protein